MKKSLLDHLVCPDTWTPFRLEDAVYDGNEIRAGHLVSEGNGKSYSIINGIPVILDDVGDMQTTQRAFGNQWKLHARGFFEKGKIFGRDEATCMRHIRDYFEIPEGNLQEGKIFLDAGCGLAPYAKAYAKNFPKATAIGVDMSESVMHIDTEGLENFHLVRCDLRKPPVRERFADIIWSYGVLHHTPNTKDAFDALAKYVAPNGKMYVWVYSQHNTKPSFIARKIMYKSYLYPAWLNYLLSFLIAVPVFIVYRGHYLVRSLDAKRRDQLKKHTYVNLATGIHDSLVPEFQRYHTRDEVRSWYFGNGFNGIRLVGDIGMVGTKGS